MDNLVGVRLAETVMSLHPVTLAQGHTILSAFRYVEKSDTVQTRQVNEERDGEGVRTTGRD